MFFELVVTDTPAKR